MAPEIVSEDFLFCSLGGGGGGGGISQFPALVRVSIARLMLPRVF